MGSESADDKYSIKNVLFSKAIPSYVIPVPTEGYKVYPCLDCGDKYLFESSYEDHVNRKSAKILYMCRVCNIMKIFYNRCNLLAHIRSHSFKKATINVSDLKVEPLSSMANYVKVYNTIENNIQTTSKEVGEKNTHFCMECNEPLTLASSRVNKKRLAHFKESKENKQCCPICLYNAKSICSLKAHIRIHLKIPPYYCCDCGILLKHKQVTYPYEHDCENIVMMKKSHLNKCAVKDCFTLFRENQNYEHMLEQHYKKIYRCSSCSIAGFDEQTIKTHVATHNNKKNEPLCWYQCELCPSSFIQPDNLRYHITNHTPQQAFQCWECHEVYENLKSFFHHQESKHNVDLEFLKRTVKHLNKKSDTVSTVKSLFRIVKKCGICNSSFTYKCLYDDIVNLPNKCPYNCLSSKDTRSELVNYGGDSANFNKIKCPVCKCKLSDDWEDIKQHFILYHENQRCVDVKVAVKRIAVDDYLKNKKQPKTDENIPIQICLEDEESGDSQDVSVVSCVDKAQVCLKCNYETLNGDDFKSHMLTHRDPCSAYQCMECGKCFVVKRSFATHLLMNHKIDDVDLYIDKNKCFNEKALNKYSQKDPVDEPLEENQCSICREKFDDAEVLKKHFRMHGMAFLKKSTESKSP